jgi:hypothetical protein
MEKIESIENIKLHNGHCLIEVGNNYHLETKGGVLIGEEVVKYNKDVHTKRTGILTRMPTWIHWESERWVTDYFPDVGSEVWVDFVDLGEAMRVTCNDKIYAIVKYTSLVMARNDKQGIRMLNGYLLAQKVPIPMKELEIEQQYYDDIYYIKYDGKANLSYQEQGALDGSKKAYIDDTSITAGDKMYMTRASAYPILEEKFYWKFSEETFYFLQRKDVIAEVLEL